LIRGKRLRSRSRSRTGTSRNEAIVVRVYAAGEAVTEVRVAGESLEVKMRSGRGSGTTGLTD
jgi:hypothetical protein